MKKQALWLLSIGGMLMGFSVLASPFLRMPGSLEDFLKGFGVALIIGALFLQRKLQRTVQVRQNA